MKDQIPIREIVAAILLRMAVIPMVCGVVWSVLNPPHISWQQISNCLLVAIVLVLLSIAVKLRIH